LGYGEVAKVRRVAYISGSRADYGLMRCVLRRVQETKSLSLSIIATGMHLSREFGLTVREIERDGFRIAARLPCLRPEDTGAGMLRSYSRFLYRLIETLENIKPDILLLLGDRWEMLAGAMAGSYMNIPVAHVHGGEVSGSIDETNRHVITRFAHIHLVATREHARVLSKIGEQPDRIHVVGAPGLDEIVSHDYAPANLVATKYGLDPDNAHLLLVQHPVVSESHLAAAQIRKTLDAIVRMRLPTTAVCPNADAGGRQMINVMKSYANRYSFIRLYRSIPREEYLGLMAASNAIVGNSSSGMIEAASFHLPSVNIGTRQAGRIIAANVLNVSYDEGRIARAIHVALSERFRARLRALKNPYGDGHTAERVVSVLAKLRPTPKLLQKRLKWGRN
jgi:UDP-N-acetylglucosamine 2-epimerase (non-hydrolysing)/GDP/UDP-N,N'-diacetylbacillosamine 2-epimerase (hydrolysing)